MKLRVGYLKQRKQLVDVEDWTIQKLEDEIRREFNLDVNANISIYFGNSKVNNAKTDKITQLGIVSGDTLIAKIEGSSNNEQPTQSNNQEEKMDTSISSSSKTKQVVEEIPEPKVEENLLDLVNFLDLLHAHFLQIGFKKFKDYNMDELCGQTKIFYFESDSTKTQIRCSCSLFSNGNEQNISSIQINAALINGDNLFHFDRKNFNSYSNQSEFDAFVKEVKDAIFGPENPLLRAMFCNDTDLTVKLFDLCGLENVLALRRTCKIAYKKSNSRYLDLHYWKKQFIKNFGEQLLPTTSNKNEPTPYRKLLLKRLRENDKAAYLSEIRESARQEMMNYYGRPRRDDDDPLRMPLQRYPQNREPDPLSFDPLRNFNENFYGQEVYRPRNPNPHVPGAPIIYPHIHDDTTDRRRPQNPNIPLERPFGIGRNNNRFM